MTPNLAATLRKALGQLVADRQRVDREIAAIQSILRGAADRGAGATAAAPRGPKSRRGRMSAAARRAVSQRMKAYWAKRRAAKPKGNAKA
jgi:hypothetical protein